MQDENTVVTPETTEEIVATPEETTPEVAPETTPAEETHA
jgi:hypothetical protein